MQLLWKQQPIVFLITVGFACIVWSQGVMTPIGGFVTLTSFFFLLAAALIAIERFKSDKPIVPLSLFEIPVVICIIAYFCIGAGTFFVAAVKASVIREIVQRTIIILVPLYVFALGPKRPEDFKTAFYWLMPMIALISLIAFEEALRIGFSAPVYALDMHKNQIAGCCAIAATISIAAMLTSVQRRRRLFFAGSCAVALLGCIASQGRAGFLCTVAGAFIMMLARRTLNARHIAYLIVSVGVVVACVLVLMPEKVVQHAMGMEKFNSNEIRVHLWNEVLPYLTQHPFHACGWGNWLEQGKDRIYDVANVLLFDWMQMSIFGAIALISVIFFAVKLNFDNAKRIKPNSYLEFLNLASLGIVVVRFTHGMLDTFWIGRGCNLGTFMAVGMAVFIKLWLDQQSRMHALTRAAGGQRKTTSVGKLAA